jgi:hypothetical protein
MQRIDRFDRELQWPPNAISRNADFQRLDDELEQVGTIISAPTMAVFSSKNNMELSSTLFGEEIPNMDENLAAFSFYEGPIEERSHRPPTTCMTHFAYDCTANQSTTGSRMDNICPSPFTTNDPVFGNCVDAHEDAMTTSSWLYSSPNETPQRDIDAIFSAFIEPEAFVQGAPF